MKAHFVICAETALVDQVAGMLSVINVFEQLTAVGYPVFMQRLAVAAMLARDDTEPPQVEIRLLVELSGQPLFETPLALDFQDKPTTRALVSLQGLVIPAPGVVRTALLTAAGELLGEFSFEAVKAGGNQLPTVNLGPGN